MMKKLCRLKNIYIAFSIISLRLDITVAFEGVSEDLGYTIQTQVNLHN